MCKGSTACDSCTWSATSLALRVEVALFVEARLVGVGGSVTFVSRAFVVIVDGRTGRLTLPKMGWFIATWTKVAGGSGSFGLASLAASYQSLLIAKRNSGEGGDAHGTWVVEVPHLAPAMRSSTRSWRTTRSNYAMPLAFLVPSLRHQKRLMIHCYRLEHTIRRASLL